MSRGARCWHAAIEHWPTLTDHKARPCSATSSDVTNPEQEGVMEKKRWSAAAGIAAGIAVAIMVSAARVGADSTQPPHGAGLQGTWVVEVTLRNCQSNAPLTSFMSLLTHAQGGTSVEVPGAAGFAPGQRTNGLGVWWHDRGHAYRAQIVALINFETAPNPPMSPGFRPGWQTLTTTINLVDHNHFESVGAVEFYDAKGDLYLKGCSSGAGQRLGS
jgi:hypothetical protein